MSIVEIKNGHYKIHPDYNFIYVDMGYGPSWSYILSVKSGVYDIVKCSKCDKPAVQLDYYFPYHNEFTLCQKHLEE